MKHTLVHKSGPYTVHLDGQYLTIEVKGYPLVYQLKLEDEGLVLDVADEHGMIQTSDGTYFFNDEMLLVDD